MGRIYVLYNKGFLDEVIIGLLVENDVVLTCRYSQGQQSHSNPK